MSREGMKQPFVYQFEDGTWIQVVTTSRDIENVLAMLEHFIAIKRDELTGLGISQHNGERE